VLIVIDTLRADFESLVAADLPNFRRLRKLCGTFPIARCGSFPTGPMRTDLLTGRLSFLEAEWALPRPGEKTLPRMLSEAGVRTTLVTDNYVALIPRLGGMLIDEFESIDFIRGAGSDPWMTPRHDPRASATDLANRPPSRSVDFELQYLANLRGWATAGGSPTHRLVASSMRGLETLAGHERFFLWVDSFACHEPWAPIDDAGSLPELPLFPAYVEAERFQPDALATWKRQYAARIEEADRELEPLVDQLEASMADGDVAVAVVSDHGFLFGDFGFVGKAPNTPLPPSLHEIVCWLSPHFASVTGPSIQPHLLHHAIRRLFALTSDEEPAAPLHVFGRNSPRSAYIAAATEETLYLGAKTDDGGATFHAVDRATLDPSVPLMSQQARTAIPRETVHHLHRAFAGGHSDWLRPFLQALASSY